MGGVNSNSQKLSIAGWVSKLIGRFWSNKHLIDLKNHHWNLSAPINETTPLKSIISDLDAIITGSDQIWNSACIEANGLYYFGEEILPTQRLIAYAPSFGKNRFEASDQIIEKLKTHFPKFKAISVREDDGLNILKNKFGVENAIKVLDPTLLMGIDYYKKLMKKNAIKQRKTLAYYILDNSSQKERWIKELSQLMNLKPVNINRSSCDKSSIIGKIRALRYPSVENWLKNIAEAQFVLTDSFHGSVFSIIFNRQFLTFGNNKRGNSRFDGLLSMFNLSSRMITDEENISLPSYEINYKEVNNLLSTHRQKSSDFLLHALA